MNDLGKRKQPARLVSRLIWMIFVVVFLGCGPGVDAVPSAIVPPTQPVPSATVTATARPSPTPSPTAIPFPVEVIDLGMREIEISPEFLNLQGGSYLLYGDFISGHPGNEDRLVFRYMSQDGTQAGSIFDSSTNGLPARWWPELRAIDTQLYVFLTDYSGSNGTTFVYRVGLLNGEVETWQIISHSNLVCNTYAGFVSHDGRWLAVDCIRSREHYIYVLDLESGTGMAVSPRGYECRDPSIGHFEWEFAWTPENQLLSWCSVGYNRANECLVSPQDGEYQCWTGDLDRVLGWSPAGNMVALYRDSENSDDQYTYFDDAACIQDGRSCEANLRICNTRDDSAGCTFAWDGTGESVAWTESWYKDIPGHYFYSSLQVMDLSTGDNRTLFYGIDGSWDVLDFSPDGRQIVCWDGGDGDIVLFSLNGDYIRQTPTGGTYLGWYVAP